MAEAVCDAIKHLRATNREDLSAVRKKDREALLRQRRLTLLEVEALVTSITLEQFIEFVLKVKDKKATVDVLRAIKNNCCDPTRSEAFMKTDGALYSLIRILVGRDAQMQLEAAACLTNLACGSHKASHRIAKAAGPYLVSFLGSGSCYLQDQSAWAAGNIANDCFACFSLLKAQGIVPALLANLQSSVPDVIRSTVYALNACTKYEDNDLRELAKQDIINYLLKFLDQENAPQSTLSDTAFTMSNIYYLAAKNNIDLDVESVLTCLDRFISRTQIDNLIAVPLVRCLGFMSQKDSVCLYLSQHSKFHNSVRRIINSECQCLKIETLWILTNISGHTEISTEVIDLNSIVKIIDAMENSSDPSIMQVLYYLCTRASKNGKEHAMLQQRELISRIEPLLNCGEKTIENITKIFFHLNTLCL